MGRRRGLMGGIQGDDSGRARSPIFAADVPDLRVELLDGWRPGRAFRMAADRIRDVGGHYADNHVPPAETQLEALRGDLFWVSPDMERAMFALASKVPPNTTLVDISQDLPALTGLIILGSPGLNTFDFDGTAMQVEALSFTPIEYDCECHSFGMMLTSYGRFWDGRRVVWVPCGYADWPLNESAGDIPEGFTLARIFACFCVLTSETIELSASSDEWPDKAVRRRSARKGLPSKVRLIHLRKTVGDEPSCGHGEGPPKAWSHRWVVSGHMRLQPCGPGRSQRRLTYVHPYVKGPENKPLITKETVYAVTR